MTRSCISLVTLVALLLGLVARAERHVNPTDFDFIEEGDWGEWDGVMTGRIIDPDGRPIPFARVRVHSKNIRTRTDRNGFFTVRGLQRGGHYSLIVDKRGFNGAILRWIPIPSQQTADIGDYHLEYALPSTNFWVVFSNNVAGTWIVNSNFYDIIEGETNVYSSAVWEQAFTEEGRIGTITTYGLIGDRIVATGETAVVPPVPLVPPALEPAALPTNVPAPSAPPAATPPAESTTMSTNAQSAASVAEPLAVPSSVSLATSSPAEPTNHPPATPVTNAPAVEKNENH